MSYNRPIDSRGSTAATSYFFDPEYPMVRWLEANAYNVSYFTNVDAARRGSELLEHQVVLSVGHDEYWSGEERAHVETARDVGVNLAFFSGNEVFWKTRWENSIDGTDTAYRTLVSYKETHAGAKIDPLPDIWTGTWRDARSSPPADGGRPENGLTGTIFTVNGNNLNSMDVPDTFRDLHFWRNTSVATLGLGQVATLPPGVLGFEWDEPLDNGSRPSGLFMLSPTTIQVPYYIQDDDGDNVRGAIGGRSGQGTWTQTTTADFAAGTSNATAVTNSSGGELQLAEVLRDDFDNATLGSAWTHDSWEAQGGGPETITIADGVLALAGTQIRSAQTFSNTPVEARISFAAVAYQHFGMASDLGAFADNYWAIFSTGGTTNRQFAKVNSSGITEDVDLGSLPAGFHNYRINPIAGAFRFYVDDLLQTTINFAPPSDTPLRIAFSQFMDASAGAMQVDSARTLSYPSSGMFASSIFDATRTANWATVHWNAVAPAGATLTVESRSGDSATPDGAWSGWTPLVNGGVVSSPPRRYFQYRITLTAIDPTVTPRLLDILFHWT